MAIRIVDDPIQAFRGIGVLTTLQNVGTTAANRSALNLRAGFREILIETLSQDSRIALVPKIVAVYWHDDSTGVWTDLLADKPVPAILDSGQTGTAAFTLAAADNLYIATVGRVGGFRFDLTSLNNNASAALVVQYSSSSGFTTVTVTDGTDTGSNTPLAQDGNITMDAVPAATAWVPILLSDVVSGAPTVDKWRWIRMSPGAALDIVSINQLIPLAVAVADDYGDSDGGHFDDAREYTIDINDSVVGALEYWTAGGSNGTIYLTWIKR